MILLTAAKNYLGVRQFEKITSGSVNVYPVQFRFDANWDGLIRTAVFRAGGTARSVVLDNANECTIPWEVLTAPRYELEVGVYGTKGGTVVLPTIWAVLGRIEEGAQLGENAQEPTPDVYQQLLDQLGEGRNAAQAAATQAKADADRAAQIAAEMDKIAAQITQDAAAAAQAKTDALAAQAKAEAAQKAAETARQAAEDAAKSTGANVTAAQAAAIRAESAANEAANALASVRELYRALQAYVEQALRAIQTEGAAQLEQITTEGAKQTAAAKAQADRAETAAGAAAGSATEAGRAQQEAENAKAAAGQSATEAAGSAKTSREAANRAELAAVRQPYPDPETGTWWAWDATTGAYVDTGETYNGNVMYATFDIDPATGVLSMTTPDGYAGPQFAINNGYLEVSISA